MDSYTKYIKRALVIVIQDLKKKSILKRIVGLYNTSEKNIYKINKIFKRII